MIITSLWVWIDRETQGKHLEKQTDVIIMRCTEIGFSVTLLENHLNIKAAQRPPFWSFLQEAMCKMSLCCRNIRDRQCRLSELKHFILEFISASHIRRGT